MKWITATFPNLHIHGVARFEDGVFRSTDPEVLARMAPWVGRYGITQVSEDTDPPDLPLRDPWPGAVLDIELFGSDGKVRESVLPPRLSDVELRAALVPRDIIGVQNGVLPSGLVQHFARVAEQRRRKGGVIGTGGKSAIAFLAAHQLDQFKSVVWPEFKARGLPIGWGAVTRAVGSPTDPFEPTTATWDDVRQHYAEGAEVWSHSHTHLEPAPKGPGVSIRQEIELSRQIIKAQGLRPMGWQYPGVATQPLTSYYYSFMPAEDYAGWSSEVGVHLLQNYAAFCWSGTGTHRQLPTGDAGYGLGYFSMDPTNFDGVKKQIDVLLDRPGHGLLLSVHPAYLGMQGRMTVADFQAVLDYVKQLWDEDRIEVLTEAGLDYADPTTTRRLDLLVDSEFDGGTLSQSWSIGAGASRSTAGGKTTPNCLSIVTDAGQGFQTTSNLIGWGANGMVHMFKGYARTTQNTTPGTARVIVESIDSAGTATVIRSVDVTLAADSLWKPVRFPVGVPLNNASSVRVTLTRAPGSPTVVFDDVHLYAC